MSRPVGDAPQQTISSVPVHTPVASDRRAIGATGIGRTAPVVVSTVKPSARRETSPTSPAQTKYSLPPIAVTENVRSVAVAGAGRGRRRQRRRRARPADWPMPGQHRLSPAAGHQQDHHSDQRDDRASRCDHHQHPTSRPPLAVRHTVRDRRQRRVRAESLLDMAPINRNGGRASLAGHSPAAQARAKDCDALKTPLRERWLATRDSRHVCARSRSAYVIWCVETLSRLTTAASENNFARVTMFDR